MPEVGETLTALHVLSRDGDMISIEINGRRRHRLHHGEVVDMGLAVGQAWTKELNAEADMRARSLKVLRSAHRLLARRSHGTRELERKLLGQGHTEDTVQRVLQRCTARGLLDDTAFGRECIAQVRAAEPAGSLLLEKHLRRHSLEESLVQELVAAATRERDAAEDALDLGRRILPAIDDGHHARTTRRLAHRLMRRGFDEDTVASTIDHLLPPVSP